MTVTGHANFDPVFEDWDDVQSEMAAIRKDLSAFHGKWVDQSSEKHSNPGLIAHEALRKLYPKHSIVSSIDYRLNPFAFPAAQIVPLEHNPLITMVGFVPLNRSTSPVPGVLVDQVVTGAFTLTWEEKKFLLFVVQYPVGLGGTRSHNFVLHEGSEQSSRQLLVECGVFSESVQNEIWVFYQGFWNKDGALWNSIQKADWKDVILKEKFKKDFQKDVYGFYDSEELYKELGIPWKRGIIMYGPPGNGKTISLKAVMKTCDAKGYTVLYVKSFQSFAGEEYSMRAVFTKARQLSPCVLVLEDLDSLINERNRSFFLNELDGLEGNDGILLMGTTNHFDRLDPGLSSRPSRFDRKYLFDDPDLEERGLYAVYWQKKLKNNKSIAFPDSLVDEVAAATEAFSFAYLKEAFVSTLVLLARLDEDEERPSFRSILMEQIEALRKQLDKPTEAKVIAEPASSPVSIPLPPVSRPLPHPWRQTRSDQIQAIHNGTFNPFAPAGTMNLPPVHDNEPVVWQRRATRDAAVAHTRSYINSLRVPGSFGEDDSTSFFSDIPSLPGSANNSSLNRLPGIQGYWR